VTLFPSSGPVCQEAARGAAELVALAHAAHAFTNTADFTLRCGVCQVCWNCLFELYEMFCHEMFCYEMSFQAVCGFRRLVVKP